MKILPPPSLAGRRQKRVLPSNASFLKRMKGLFLCGGRVTVKGHNGYIRNKFQEIRGNMD